MSQLKKDKIREKQSAALMPQSAFKLIFDENRNIEKVRPKNCGLCGRKLALGSREENGERRQIRIFYLHFLQRSLTRISINCLICINLLQLKLK